MGESVMRFVFLSIRPPTSVYTPTTTVDICPPECGRKDASRGGVEDGRWDAVGWVERADGERCMQVVGRARARARRYGGNGKEKEKPKPNGKPPGKKERKTNKGEVGAAKTRKLDKKWN
jgi:hypothetical protein